MIMKNITLSTDMMDSEEVSAYVESKIGESDYTSFEVFPTETVISGKNSLEAALLADPSLATNEEFLALSARSWNGKTGLQWIEDIPAGKTAAVCFYTTKMKSDCDVVIDWGDGTTNTYKNDIRIPFKDIPFDHNLDDCFRIDIAVNGSGRDSLDNRFPISDIQSTQYSDDGMILEKIVSIAANDITFNRFASLKIPSGTTYNIVHKTTTGYWTNNYWLEFNDGTEDKSYQLKFYDWRDPSGLNGLIFFENVDNEQDPTNQWNNVQYVHTYATEGRYSVKVTGNDTYGLRCSLWYGVEPRLTDSGVQYLHFNLVSDAFGQNYKFSTKIKNASSLLNDANRLQKVVFPINMVENMTNTVGLFNNCINLIEVYSGSQNTVFQHITTDNQQMFTNCKNLKTLNGFKYFCNIHKLTGTNSLYGMYMNCSSLEQDVLDLLPVDGFKGYNINVQSMFSGCSKVTCSNYTLLENLLWGDTTKNWVENSSSHMIGCFTNCSSLDLTKIPTKWGGTKA